MTRAIGLNTTLQRDSFNHLLALAVFTLGSFVLHNYMLLNIGWRQSMLQGIAYSAQWIVVGVVISLVYRA